MTLRPLVRYLLLGIVLLAGAVLTAWLSRPYWRAHKEARAVNNALSYLHRGDLTNAALCARQALSLNPSNLVACSLMAELAEAAGRPQAIEWRRRILQIQPNIENQLRFAGVALKLEPAPFTNASAALSNLSVLPQTTNIPGFQLLSADLALKQGRVMDALCHLDAAAALDPTNDLHRVNAAALRLSSTNETTARAARIVLEQVTMKESFRGGAAEAVENATNGNPRNARTLALRWLATDWLRRSNYVEAKACSERLIALPSATLPDKIQHLEILHWASLPEVENWIYSLRVGVGTNLLGIHTLATWMNTHGRAQQVVTWLTNLPPSVLSTQPVRTSLAHALSTAGEWSEIDARFESEQWGDSDFLRLAWLSHAETRLRQDVQAKAHWKLALHHAGNRLVALISLADLAASWNELELRHEVLWRIIDRFPREHWAVSEMDRSCSATGNTRGLYKLYSMLLDSLPADATVKNNFAATAMLLKLDLQKAFAVAEQNFAKNPLDPIIVSTYAFSLNLQQKPAEALKVLEKLRLDDLKESPLALYYALTLCANDKHDRAVAVLNNVDPTKLLPEERALFETLSQKVK